MHLLVAVMTLLLCGQASATDVALKCKDKNGKITLSNTVCPEGTKQELLVVEPNVVDSSELRAWNYRSPPRREAASANAGSGNSQTSTQAINPVDCSNAKRSYEFAAGYKYARPGEAYDKAKEVFRACGYWP